MRGWRFFAACMAMLLGCSLREYERESGKTDGGSGVENVRYDPSGTIPCQTGPCKAPQFCCIRPTTPNTCETERARCDGEELARLRCADSTSCAQGYVCCLRLENFGVASVECEPDCTGPRASTGAFRLCSDGDAFGVCPGRCTDIRTILNGQTSPGLEVRACE
jgi:hypothetical protein